MKKNLLSLCVFTFILCNLSYKSFAQDGREAGGNEDGIFVEPCPVSVKRNNGNGYGVCHGDAQIRVTFSQLPSVIPQLTAIIYTNSNTGSITSITSVQLPVNGDLVDRNHPYISYCLTGILPAPGNSQGNIPPAVKFVLEFTYPGGQVCRTGIEE